MISTLTAMICPPAWDRIKKYLKHTKGTVRYLNFRNVNIMKNDFSESSKDGFCHIIFENDYIG
jgi:hypothetical protein